MKMFTVNWSAEQDETKIKFTDGFYQSSWIEQLDCLKDAIHELTDVYDFILEDLSGDSMTKEKHEAMKVEEQMPTFSILNFIGGILVGLGLCVGAITLLIYLWSDDVY